MALSPLAHVAIQGVLQADGKWVLGWHLLTLTCGEVRERKGKRATIIIHLNGK